MRRSSPRSRARRGLTLVELVVASGLLTLLMLAIFSLLDSFLSMWDKSEQRRQLAEGSQGIVELLASDFAALDAGGRGDLLCEWVAFDTDADSLLDRRWPRIRMVRHASDGELARLQGNAPDREVGEGLLEVCWAVLPARPHGSSKDQRRDELAEGFLWRGERVYGSADATNPSFFRDDFLSGSGKPRPGSVDEVSGGVLWLGMQFATQLSWLRDGWRTGPELTDVTASWDAWSRGRPDLDHHFWNEAGAGVPVAEGRPALPRRVRLALELERPGDLKRRTRLARFLDAREGTVTVLDSERLPALALSGPASAGSAELGTFVLVDAEWMELRSVLGDTVQVRRGARGTTAQAHEAGALVHYGTTLVREIPIALHREDWDF